MIQNVESLNEECKENVDNIQGKIKDALNRELDFLKGVGSVDIKFNLMDTGLDFMKIVYNSEGNFGVYSMAEALLNA